MSPDLAAAPQIAIVDYGMGNRRSVEKALEHVGARAVVTADHDAIAAADGVVVPGVGAFPLAMERLNATGLVEVIRERLATGVPLLGICLGMQLALDSSTEGTRASGLGLIPGVVRELRPGPPLKLPHIGWSTVRWERDCELLAGLPRACAFYHVHSFCPVAADPADVLATAEYGERFVTAMTRANFYGVQFHPEKSSIHGLRLLGNFAAICARRGAPASTT